MPDLIKKSENSGIEHTLADRMKEIAMQTGVSTETLLNLWVKDKIEENVIRERLPV